MPYKDKEKQKEYFKEYHIKNKDKAKEYFIKYKDKIRLQQKEYYIKNKEKHNKASKEWYKNNPEWKKNYNKQDYEKNKLHYKELSMIRRWGITLEKYVEMLCSQKHKCLICGISLDTRIGKYGKNINIDHCHKTNKIRGILCHNCNKGLGHFKDNIQFLENAINYLGDNNG